MSILLQRLNNIKNYLRKLPGISSILNFFFPQTIATVNTHQGSVVPDDPPKQEDDRKKRKNDRRNANREIRRNPEKYQLLSMLQENGLLSLYQQYGQLQLHINVYQGGYGGQRSPLLLIEAEILTGETALLSQFKDKTAQLQENLRALVDTERTQRVAQGRKAGPTLRT